MRFSYAVTPFDTEGPRPSEVATLADKLSSDCDSNNVEERDIWLCAEYMLTQRGLIQCQLDALRDNH